MNRLRRLSLSDLVRRPRDERGYAAMLVAALAATILLPLSAMSVDVSRWYVEIERVQAAADAAAMAGVTYMPNDFSSAQSTALAVAARNGYPNSGGTTVTAAVGPKPTQLVVTVKTTIKNSLASSFNKKWAVITRSATADYNGPAPMGSPCNTFGNEPAGTNLNGPVGSQLVVPAGGAQCSTNPKFWGSVHGPWVYKTQGDQIMTRYCKGYESGCSGGSPQKNDEFEPNGYFYVVRVGAAAVGSPVTLQIYDPAYAPAESNCTGVSGTGPSSSTSYYNDYTNTDAGTRYKDGLTDFCAGDSTSNGNRYGSSEVPTVTSFGLRSPIDTFVPTDAAPVAGCAKQYPGYSSSQMTFNALKQSSSSYNINLARVYHQWVTMCTFTPTTTGDYYLQVRTNVPLSTSSPDGKGGYSSTSVYNSGDNTSVQGNGTNMFSLRAISSQAGALSIAGWEHMSVFANSPVSVSTFNLVRVVPAAASKTMVFQFFDAGDAASGSGSIQILPPTESTLSLNNCTASGQYTGTLTNCKVTGVSGSSGWNGQAETIKVPIPNDYDCNVNSAGGCWFRVVVDFGSASSVTDVTTWSAKIEGDPVRLIK
ncbi:pilus assembly protein TadG-related protein [Nocardioides sp.]|uniref:pilus assembly protein TadG-related protein n=1 Tax=Nocardioides sp. TaxID=35761 RepID=UPI003528B1ED